VFSETARRWKTRVVRGSSGVCLRAMLAIALEKEEAQAYTLQASEPRWGFDR
jgi:hypothetical protein